MIFNSLEFLIFLPCVFFLYWMVFKGKQSRNILIVIASYFFYGWWDVRFLSLIIFTTFCSYFSGILLEKYDDNKKRRKLVCAANLIVNLIILGIFKYFNFFAENFTLLLNSFGLKAGFTTTNIVLPVGISFYTFQALSYTIDVYRREIKATHNYITFTAFISFFPQLVAGPIERAKNLLPQFEKQRYFNHPNASDGIRLILWGFFKKIVIADNCAPIVDSIFRQYYLFDGIELVYGAIIFSIQIYGDFSGYSDIAIGTGKLFGIDLMKNFNRPYFALNIPDFWRRWHISLTSWFRDYVYIPMGGNRKGKLRCMLNTFVVFAVSGLWHGANWTFVAWGLFHSIFFAPYIFFKKKHLLGQVNNKLLASVEKLVKVITTFSIVTLGWIIFRSPNITEAWLYIKRMFTTFTFSIPTNDKRVCAFIVIMFTVEWLMRKHNHSFDIGGVVKSRTLRHSIYYTIIVVIFMYLSSSEDFIYFQF